MLVGGDIGGSEYRSDDVELRGGNKGGATWNGFHQPMNEERPIADWLPVHM